jgi:hypothetical protein
MSIRQKIARERTEPTDVEIAMRRQLDAAWRRSQLLCADPVPPQGARAAEHLGYISAELYREDT